ncbi:maleylpyruvate isomerase family mycothiol-dependent enzyme [Nocardioides sp. LHD-245]|uniref:maleylpyruvate isomerase family mycothiol-dependent enzyme n=1 Tax=Nocardioides sp. LHD-245 TaxID=3051387 RepID=UPI0027E0F36B|nr:maleylpyruvate isomerase family mycothiol-dependent enzyme [Nocardioides sp. LHD-245]
MTRTPADLLRWMREGQELFDATAARLDAAACAAPSTLPTWTRGHVLAHVAANADALLNLARWASSGTEIPMYASPEERAAGIARGGVLPPARLAGWQARSADALAAALGELTDEQWCREVRTAQGRTVPATEIPWLRTREVMVHAVDLDLGTTFADLPADVLAALDAEVSARRGPDLPEVTGPLADRVAWLTGRPHRPGGLSRPDGTPAPDLGPWL